jgi:hypothetical protein
MLTAFLATLYLPGYYQSDIIASTGWKMEARGSSETSLNFYQTARRHTQKVLRNLKPAINI